MYIEFSNNQFVYYIDSTEYKYENDSYLVLCDINYDSNKQLNFKISDFINKNLNGNIFGGYFVVIIDKTKHEIHVHRDVSGIKSGYYGQSNINFCIGNNVHDLAKKLNVVEFNEIATDMLLITEFIQDGLTIYKNIHEFTIGSSTKLFFNGEIIEKKINKIPILNKENGFSYEENISKLRECIVDAHKNLVSTNNIVYLSGGIDSCVMLAALDDFLPKSSIHTISYKVKGTNQDETPYAQSIAKYLGVTNEIIEFDPNSQFFCDNFENKLLKLNNPYIGYWIFSPNDNSIKNTYFAGQDTRLHTPAINQLDKINFNLFSNNNYRIISKKSLKNVSCFYDYIYYKLCLYNSNNKIIKNSDRVFASLDCEKYIYNYFLKLNHNKINTDFHKMENFNLIKEYYHINLNNIKSPRELYNEIIKIKWGEQYTDDIRYMQDMAKATNTYIQMPFYAPELAEFSSSIPFNFATKFIKGKKEFSDKTVRVNKVLLRNAFKDKLNEDVFSRKKAVSTTNHLLFNGTLGLYIKRAIKEDLLLPNDKSFIKRYGYDKALGDNLYVDFFKQKDYAMIIKLYYLSTLCIYNKFLLC